jgi:3D (Asp-Asp-Asp) domain-containing protein
MDGPLADNGIYTLVDESIRTVTAYNAGDPLQTDDTPCTSANGEDICRALEAGQKHCAANFVPLGTELHIETYGWCRVSDRTHPRYRDRVDIAMKKEERRKATAFGKQQLRITGLRKAPGDFYLVLRGQIRLPEQQPPAEKTKTAWLPPSLGKAE